MLVKASGYRKYLESPLGWLEIIVDDQSLLEINFVDKPGVSMRSRLLDVITTQLNEYFRGKRTEFDLPLQVKGSDFQKKVWRGLQAIPFGKTVSYKQLAELINLPKAVRAVGSANGKNPIPIIIPCHRVIASGGGLGGYSGGLDKKTWLLNLEKHH